MHTQGLSRAACAQRAYAFDHGLVPVGGSDFSPPGRTMQYSRSAPALVMTAS